MNSELHWESQPNIFAQLLQSATASTKSDVNNSNNLSPSSSMDYGVLNMNLESLPYPSRVTPKLCCPLSDHDLHKAPTGLPPLVSSHNYLGTVGTVALRKEYESLADQERKDDYRTSVVERLKKLCVDDAQEAKSAVGMEIAQGVDFLKVSTKSDLNNSNNLSPSSSMDHGVLNMNVESLPSPTRVTPKPCCPLLDHDLHKAPTGMPPRVCSHNYLGTVGTAALRKEYESLAGQERKDEYKTRVVERLKKLCVDDALEAKTAVGMEIAQGVDFLKVLDSSHPKLAELVEISDNSREGVAKLIDGLRLVERAQNRLRSVLHNEGASSAQ